MRFFVLARGGVSTITAFLTPFLIRASPPAARWLERGAPARLASVMQYLGWVGRLRRYPQKLN